MKATSDEDKRALVKIVDEALADLAVRRKGSRTVIVIDHALDENPLPEMFDYLESIGIVVENVFTIPRPQLMVLSREILVKVKSYAVWDGTVE